jgi:cation diffusion facilitator CzcD-associated flavoprotein CzcO
MVAAPASPAPAPGVGDVHIAVVGPGFGGIAAAIRLRQHGISDFVVFEATPRKIQLQNLGKPGG